MNGAIKVELHEHSPCWAALAFHEAQRLQHALGSVLIAVHHIGSTSVPGILAKPIIDLLPVVTDLEALDRQRPKLEDIGYESWKILAMNVLASLVYRAAVTADAAIPLRGNELSIYTVMSKALPQ
jgi:GrpB-like predicted nucleotidyltransferase (UPF0157 family)